MSATVQAESRFTKPSQFEDVILRTNTDGTTVRLKDVARVELGAFQYGRDTQLDNVPVAGVAIQLLPGANALAVTKAVEPASGRLLVHTLRQLGFHQYFDQRSRQDTDRSRYPRVHRNAAVSAEPARDVDPDYGGAGRTDGCLHRHVRFWLHDQPAHFVRHGASDRNRGR